MWWLWVPLYFFYSTDNNSRPSIYHRQPVTEYIVYIEFQLCISHIWRNPRNFFFFCTVFVQTFSPCLHVIPFIPSRSLQAQWLYTTVTVTVTAQQCTPTFITFPQFATIFPLKSSKLLSKSLMQVNSWSHFLSFLLVVEYNTMKKL